MHLAISIKMHKRVHLRLHLRVHLRLRRDALVVALFDVIVNLQICTKWFI